MFKTTIAGIKLNLIPNTHVFTLVYPITRINKLLLNRTPVKQQQVLIKLWFLVIIKSCHSVLLFTNDINMNELFVLFQPFLTYSTLS